MNGEGSSQRRKQRLYEHVNLIKEKGCVECGEKDRSKLNFHHRNPSEKYKNISDIITRHKSFRLLKIELEKCDLLCLECHDKEHGTISNPNRRLH